MVYSLDIPDPSIITPNPGPVPVSDHQDSHSTYNSNPLAFDARDLATALIFKRDFAQSHTHGRMVMPFLVRFNTTFMDSPTHLSVFCFLPEAVEGGGVYERMREYTCVLKKGYTYLILFRFI
jgi:hypothetical protein